MKLSEIPSAIGDNVTILRDGDFDAVALLGLRRDESKKHISFVLGEGYVDVAKKEGVRCLICPGKIADKVEQQFEGGACISDDPKATFFKVHEYLSKSNSQVKTPSFIDPTARIAKTAVIADNNVTIGKNVEIQDYAVIKENVSIGDNSVVMEECVLGTPAFYYYGDNETRQMVFSSGGIAIGCNTVIHSHVTICKGVIGGNTCVGNNSALDNNTFLGHDVIIGNNVIVAAGNSFGGWVEIGDNCFFGVGCSVAPMVTVGKNVKGSIGAVITKNVPDNSQVSGNFAIDHELFIDDLKKKL